LKTIGVDLGTTNSCVYYLDESGNPVVVLDERGNSIFPSVVWCAGPGKERVVGHKAKARVGTRPAPVVAVKRRMGTDQKVQLGDRMVSPVEVSTEILRHARKLVEAATHDLVDAVVVTVPAYFDVAPRRDTQLAAVQAFFDGDENKAKDRLELQLEPEAAAYAYLANNTADRMLVLVYDLGGGTFDVTVLEKSPEEGLTPIAFGGDPHLGGDNADDRLASWIAYRIRGGRADALTRILSHGRYGPEDRYTVLQQVMSNDVAGLRGILRAEDRDLLIPNPPRFELELDASKPEDLVRIQKLKWLAENAKLQLTLQPQVAILQQSIFMDNAGEIVDVDMDLSLTEFNLLIGDMIDRTIRSTLAVVEKSGRKQSEFDCVVLVGGSSRMPVVAEELKKVFTAPVLLQNAMADKIVAQGAAMRAGSLKKIYEDTKITLEYPQQTADSQVTIAGRLAQPLDGGKASLTPVPGDAAREMDVEVEAGRFLFRGAKLTSGSESRFQVEVRDARGEPVADAKICILRSDKPFEPLTTKITKPIRYLARSGFKVLFNEGEPLPATRTEICQRGGREDFVSIPIYEGERPLRDLRILGVDRALNVGAEIRFSITIERDYSVRCSAEIVSTKQINAVEFGIEPIRMPSLDQLDSDKEKVLEEIENGLGAIKDPNVAAPLRRGMRRLEGEYTRARTANEPDSHHLYTLIGEMGKLKTEIVRSQDFLKPPLGDFKGVIRVCRHLAGKLDENAAVSKDEILEKIAALDSAGTDAWNQENRGEWNRVNEEANELRRSLDQAIDGPGGEASPEAIQQAMLNWLTEIAGQVKQKDLQDEFGEEIENLKEETRGVDLRDRKDAREKLITILQEKLKPLERKVKVAGVASGLLL
jgi:molecular chaperone DnaK (HSP70)